MSLGFVGGAILSVVLVANASEPVDVRLGETTIDSCSLLATDVVGILYCVLWVVLLGAQEEDAKGIYHAVKVRNRSEPEDWRNRQIDDIISTLVTLPETELHFGKYEVTQGQWEAVMGNSPSRFVGDDNPVECVSWGDCQEFLKKFNDLPAVKKSGLIFRLPTEVEWEYACRAGLTGDYCMLLNGTDITADSLSQVAWFKNNSNGTTHPVGQKDPNAFGLYDMHGNVWEWTSTLDGRLRVGRGGSWYNSAGFCEASRRVKFSSSYRNCYLGFRLCADGSK